MTPLKLGVSLHSFTTEYTSYVWSMEDLMELVGQLGKGVEIVGPSHQRGFPVLSPEFEVQFKSAVDRWGLIPTSYGSYADPFMLPDRDLSPKELVDYTIPQLIGAARLGFPIVRLQHFTAEVIGELLPWAEKLGLWLGWELHTPLTIGSARVAYLVEQIERFQSDRLGLIPDAGIFAGSVGRVHIEQGARAGVAPEQIATVVAAWDAGLTLEQVLGQLGDPDPASSLTTWVSGVWDTYGHSDPEELLEIWPYVRHIHGKFFSIVDGAEPNLRYRELVGVLVREGYEGWISSELEGEYPDSADVIARHQDMIRRYEAQALLAPSPDPTPAAPTIHH